MSVNTNIRVLIVDDSSSMLKIMRNLLNRLDFNNVEEASDGVAAMDVLKENDGDFGLIISDWKMEPMSGIQLLYQVRADDRLWSIPFIIVTAENKSEYVIMAKEAGVSDYIIKPFDAETLNTKLESVFGDI
jgi:two-component system chemotaxis response regulator CheY